VEAAEVSRAVAAASSIAEGLDLPVEHAGVLCNSNKLALRLLPCDVFARVAHAGHGLAQLEVELALRLAAAGGPVAALEPRVKPRGYEHDGFEVTLWTYYEPATPHFTERVADAPGHIARTPALDDADRELLHSRLRDLSRAVTDRGAPEQLLHGEPHQGNVLATKRGLRFIDLETCCRGPVEFDLAHVPAAVSEHYPDADQALLQDCRGLVLAVVAKHRCDPGDQFPNGQRALRDLLTALRAGPPWPALDVVMGE
jgi:hypothetical protein